MFKISVLKFYYGLECNTTYKLSDVLVFGDGISCLNTVKDGRDKNASLEIKIS